MTSKERLMAVLNKIKPDRVPISTYELVGWNFDSWENQQPSYRPIMDLIREKTDCMYMYYITMDNAYLKEHSKTEVRVAGNSTFTEFTIFTPQGPISSLTRKDEGINTIWSVEHLVKEDSDLEKYMSIPFDPIIPDLQVFSEKTGKLGEKGIMLITIPDPLCIAADLYEFGDFTIKAYTDRKEFSILLQKIFEEQMFFYGEILRKGAGPLFRICGPEYATPPYLNEELFHDYVCKFDKKIISLIHDHKQYARIHSHGKIRKILPHIIEMEADALDPLESPPSGDIQLDEVKRLYGKDLCLMGNLQLRDIEYCTEDEMRKKTHTCMKDAKEGGGFVIMPTAAPINAQLSSVTQRNYEVFIETALECGEY